MSKIADRSSVIENTIRPTAFGKKNWMLVGGEDTGERSAVIYIIIESAKRYDHEPHSYLKDMLEWLPGMKVGELDILLPANLQPFSRAGPRTNGGMKPTPINGCTVELFLAFRT